MENGMGPEFREQIRFRMEESRNRIRICLSELSEEELWKRPNASSNSVGNLILHLIGNITQWVRSSLGKEPDLRERDSEFSALGGSTKSQLLDRFDATLDAALETIRTTDDATLTEMRSVQGFRHSGIGILVHVAEHLSYHTGQIGFWTKMLKDKDLGYYRGVDLNRK